jgi:hypothetical protein
MQELSFVEVAQVAGGTGSAHVDHGNVIAD